NLRSEGGGFAVGGPDRVVEPSLATCSSQALDIAQLVTEPQRVERHFRHRDVEPSLVVEHRFEARGGAHPHVVIRAGDDELIGLDILIENELASFRAFDPQVLRHFAPKHAADLRPHIGNPVHCIITRGKRNSSRSIALPCLSWAGWTPALTPPQGRWKGTILPF